MGKKEKAAYMITSGVVVDPGRMPEYLEAAAPLFDQAGAEELAFGHVDAKNIEVLEGKWDHPGLVMLYKFPSKDAIRKFWDTPEYQAVKKLRDEGIVDPNFTIVIEERN